MNQVVSRRLLIVSMLIVIPLLAAGCQRGSQGDSAQVVANAVAATGPVSPEPIEVATTDWPWWRGAERDSHAISVQVPLRWEVGDRDGGLQNGAAKARPSKSADAGTVVWRAAVAGRGLSTPSLWGDRIFLTTADEEAETIAMLGYRRTDGERLWSCQLHQGGFLVTHDKNSQASPTPACDGELVFVPHAVQHDGATGIWVSAVDLEGQLRWQTLAGGFNSVHGYGSSPVLYGSLLIVAGDCDGAGFLAALDRTTGEVRWRIERPQKTSFATPTVAHVAGRDQLLIHGTSLVTSYDPLSGEEIWRCDGPSRAAANTMVADDELVFASGGYPEKFLLAIRADGTGDVTDTHLVWKKRKAVCYVPSMLLDDGKLFTVNDDGIAKCYVAATGEELWTERLEGAFSASPVLAGDRIYIPNEAGKLYVFRAADKFEMLAENDLGDGGFATPVIVGGRIYLRTNRWLYCIGS
ncbi:MAG: serine/threonine protein kinase [Planctomycetota bacterium]|nr:MAG: serine/threonine protein kinase [Planctomycetota bacterium]REJ92267.1 MAG: serine/threonine protein kinase [Planctomycetota bacterium]REK18570.1 MAG: serine/threonine protein kinase [Planctomycetota bacterium]REK49211.1 MAG: serine/threonine protein kinase [Planctomycetota bacterium]